MAVKKIACEHDYEYVGDAAVLRRARRHERRMLRNQYWRHIWLLPVVIDVKHLILMWNGEQLSAHD